jgi:hypothetical protein
MTHVVDRIVVPEVDSAGDSGAPRVAGATHIPEPGSAFETNVLLQEKAGNHVRPFALSPIQRDLARIKHAETGYWTLGIIVADIFGGLGFSTQVPKVKFSSLGFCAST